MVTRLSGYERFNYVQEECIVPVAYGGWGACCPQ